MRSISYFTNRWKRTVMKQAVHTSDRLLVHTYSASNLSLANSMTGLLSTYRARFRSQVSMPNFPLYRLEGPAENRNWMRALVRVDAHSRVYIPWLLYGSSGPAPLQIPVRGDAEFAAHVLNTRADLDLVVMAMHRAAPTPKIEGDWLRIPDTIRMVIDFQPEDTWEQVEKQLRRTQEHNMSLVRRGGYRYETSTRRADFDFFIDRMYRPMVLNRHSDHASLSQLDWLEEQFEHGYIGKVIDAEGNWVSGELGQDRGKVHFGLVLGVLDGRRDLLRKGALAAVYVSVIRACLENGMRRLDGGPNIAFAEDGVVKHKLRWGFHPVEDPWGRVDWLFWSPCSTPTAHTWFDAHPTIGAVTRRGGAYWKQQPIQRAAE